MYDIYYLGELIHTNLTYEQSMNILRDLSEKNKESGEYDPQQLEMVLQR
jgi:hypothetical protein